MASTKNKKSNCVIIQGYEVSKRLDSSKFCRDIKGDDLMAGSKVKAIIKGIKEKRNYSAQMKSLYYI